MFKTRDSRDGTIQCPLFSDTQHGTAGTGQSNVPYFQTHSRDGTVPCFLVENTGQPGWDNPMSRIFRHTTGTGHWIVPSRLSRVFSLKTRDSRDGTIQCPLFSDTQPGRDCPVFSTRKHRTAGTGRYFFFLSRPVVPGFSIELISPFLSLVSWLYVLPIA